MIPLFDPAEMSNFPVGLPALGAGQPRCPGIDFSGNDPHVQMPRNWRSIAGGTVARSYDDKYFVGRSWPDCSDVQPDRLFVMPGQMRPDGSRGNVLYLLGGIPGRAGTSNLAHAFDLAVLWREVQIVKVIAWLMPLSEPTAPHYLNLEPRGRLDVTPHAEAQAPFSLVLRDRTVVVKWWNEVATGDNIKGKLRAERAWTMRSDQWLRAAIRLTPLPAENQWSAHVRIEQGDTRVVWNTPPDRPIRHTLQLDEFYVGDEIGRDPQGGAWKVAELSAYARPLLSPPAGPGRARDVRPDPVGEGAV